MILLWSCAAAAQSEEAGEENPTTGEPNAAEPETNADSDGGATGGEEVGGTDAPAGGQEAEAADAPPADDSQNEPQADGDTGAQAEEAWSAEPRARREAAGHMSSGGTSGDGAFTRNACAPCVYTPHQSILSLFQHS